MDIEGFHLSTYKISPKKVRSGRPLAIWESVSNISPHSQYKGAKSRSPVKWLAVAPDSEGSILIAYADGQIALWGLKQKKTLKSYEPLLQPLESCAWHPEGKFFITGYEVMHSVSLLCSYSYMILFF